MAILIINKITIKDYCIASLISNCATIGNNHLALDAKSDTNKNGIIFNGFTLWCPEYINAKSPTMFKNGSNEYTLKPRDTIYIEQKMFSKLITSSNLPTIFLSILNIALTLERTN